MGLFDEVSDAVLGVDNRILKTLRDLVLRPGRVADADMTPDNSPYMSQVRLFVAMFGLQTFLFSIFKFAEHQKLSVLAAASGTTGAARAQLPAGVTLAQVDAVALDWYNYTTWPALIFGSLLYIGIFYAMRPSLSLRAHIAVYATASNVGSLAFAAMLALGVLTGRIESFLLIGAILYLAIFFWLLVRFLRRWYARTAIGVIGKFAILLILTIPVSLVMFAVQFGAVHYAVHRATGADYAALFHTVTSADVSQAQDTQS